MILEEYSVSVSIREDSTNSTFAKKHENISKFEVLNNVYTSTLAL